MITTTYYNVEQRVYNSPKGAGIWGWTNATMHDKITDRAEAEAIMIKKRQGWVDYLAKEMASATDQDLIDHLANLQANADFRIVEDVKTFAHASMYGYSDVHAYEIVKVISDKTIEVRKMSAKHDIAHLKQYTGGFCGHVANQHNQKVSYASDPTALTIRIRRKKNNPEAWTANGQRFGLTEAPYAFYDYNFQLVGLQ